MKFDKPFLNYEEQIKRLQDVYKLEINDVDFAIHALSTVSYYDLINGYKDVFIDNGSFKSGITIEYLYHFHLFDKKFQNILFRMSAFIENLFKARESYVIAEKLGVDYNSYLDENNFLQKTKSISTSYEDVKKEIMRAITATYPQQPTKHYIKTHNHIPPWILFRNISFGNSINIYRLMKPSEKTLLTNALIANDSIEYKQKVELITNGLNIIRSFRNKVAHNLKFVTYKSSNGISRKTARKLLPSGLLTKNDVKEGIGSNDIYSLILIIVIFLNDNYLIAEFLDDILALISLDHCPLESVANKQNRTTIYKDYANITGLPENLPLRIQNLSIK